MKRKIYIARRILPDPTGEITLNVTDSMDVEEVTTLYIGREIEKEKFIHNGHWILRPVDGAGMLKQSTLPISLSPQNILEMVRAKIDSSDALVALLGPSSFGAVVELGYAVGRGNIAVYVLPEKDTGQEKTQDLWLSFQFSLQTKHLWRQEDITGVEDFAQHNILTIKDYEDFILNIIPPFLKRK